MEKHELDTLYHLLRKVSNEGNQQTSTEITDAVFGLAGHLLAGRDYLRLIQYSRYYGEKFLLGSTYSAIENHRWFPKRLVDFGAGLGWLSRGLAVKFKGIPEVVTVDKRPWGGTDVLADLEELKGIELVYSQMKNDDIIVMSDFLHCITNPKEILTRFSAWPMVILEYSPIDEDWAKSYGEQVGRYGGNCITPEALTKILEGISRGVDIQDLDPYILILVDRDVSC